MNAISPALPVRQVRSPWTPPVAAPPPAPPARLDAVTLGGPSRAEGLPEKRPPILRSLLLGLSVAASLLGPAALGTAAAQTAALQAPSIQVSSSERLIDRMIAPGTSAADTERARASLRKIPAPALQLLARNGTRVVVMKPGMTPHDVGLVKPVDLHAFDAPAPLVSKAREAMERTDRIFHDRLQALQSRVSGLEAHEGDEPSPTLVRARRDLARVEAERDLVMRSAVQQATDNLLEPAMAEDAIEMGRLARVSPVTLRDLAENHDAKGEAEVREYAALVGRINGDRVQKAEKMYGVDEHDKPPLERSMMAYEARMLVPALKYVGGQPLYSHDVEAVEAWRDNQVLGQYYYRGNVNTVLVAESALGQADHDALLHEMGHAFEDAKATLEPASFPAYLEQRDAAFARLEASTTHPYHDAHAGEAPNEMAAQTFADLNDHKDGPLLGADPAWIHAFEAWQRYPPRALRDP